ncbi:MAG: hypothetical protein K2I49_01005 [Ureaplasma sp.]|nr:hypothetical protein [Ureaplasma sp.]
MINPLDKKDLNFLSKRKLNLPNEDKLIKKSKRLKGNKLFSYRLNDKYRIIWKWLDYKIIQIVLIGNRNNIYKNI